MADQVFKGWKAAILIGSSTIGYCESASVEISTGVEPYYQIGSRTPATLVEGNEEITGSISRAWVNTYYLTLCTGSTGLTNFNLVFKAGGSGAPWVYAYNCKFETGAIDVPQDGFLTEDFYFRATSIGFQAGT